MVSGQLWCFIKRMAPTIFFTLNTPIMFLLILSAVQEEKGGCSPCVVILSILLTGIAEGVLFLIYMFYLAVLRHIPGRIKRWVRNEWIKAEVDARNNH